MKKILAVLFAAAMLLCTVSCGTEADTPEDDLPAATEPTDTEPEAPKEEPPIEVSEFSDPEEMPAVTEDGSEPAEFTSPDYAISVGDRSFDLKWIYYQNIHDWAQAGITFDQIEEKTYDYLSVPMTDEAAAALKQKISDFSMLLLMGTTDGSVAPDSAPEISVGEEVYGIEWLSSHNATQYTEAGISADIVSQYLEAIEADFGYTPEYRWIKEVLNRLVNGW